MKLTALQRQNPATTTLATGATLAKFFRTTMRAAALKWRRWSNTPLRELSADALASAIYNRNAALHHERRP